MLYRPFGKTNLKISALGFGTMRLPIPPGDDPYSVEGCEEAVQLLRQGIDLGINYLDGAYFYCNNRCEAVIGKALEDGYREKVLLSTKLPPWSVKKPDDVPRILEDQLKRLNTGYIDFYHFHAIGKEAFENVICRFHLIEMAQKFIDQKIIRHLSFSFHDPDPNVMKTIIDTGAFSSVLCQYNLLDRSNEENIAYAHEKGLGVVVMGPVGGGRLAFGGGVFEEALDGRFSTPELALRFVLNNPGVSCALSGMNTAEMIKNNVAIASNPETLTEKEAHAIDLISQKCAALKDLYCTGCGYCNKECPQKINIPGAFEALILDKVYGLKDAAKERFRNLDAEQHPDKCLDCGICEKFCPQQIPIRQRLQECLECFR